MQLRFTIRTVAVSVLVCTIPFAVWLNRVDKQHRAVLAIERAGGNVSYATLGRLEFGPNASLVWTRNGKYFDYYLPVTAVQIDHSNYNDPTKDAISELESLKYIFVTGLNSKREEVLMANDFPGVSVVNWRHEAVRH